LKEDLKGEVVLVTAGPTREPLDPVRYISNRSSGKMGYALAQAAQRRGARTVLISGPTALIPPEGVEFIPVVTAAEMRRAVLEQWPRTTIAVKAAAVADYRPRQASSQKIRKAGREMTVDLEPTEDILAEVGGSKDNRILVGFAAETEQLVERARGKLRAKNLDLIVANDVSDPSIGFDSDDNTVVILGRDGLERRLTRLPKSTVAHEILDEVVRLRANGKS
jgi:phosphopantothenoylcysteine decarboxylase/phosphopantothenate--cysteine ligase